MPDPDRFSLLEMDPLPNQQCRICKAVNVSLDADMLCRGCYTRTRQQIPVLARAIAVHAVADLQAQGVETPVYDGFLELDGEQPEHTEQPQENEPPQTQESVVPEFSEIAAESTANAATVGSAAADGGGALGVVGFRTQEGYIQAIRNGVKAETHRQYLEILRGQYKLSGAAIAKLDLPGPMAETTLPEGKGITHTPTGPSIFDKPASERAFVVGPKSQAVEKLDVSMTDKTLVAGAVAEGHHAIIAWEGTSGMTRGQLLDALKGIGRMDWAPRAPNARAQAGHAIATLARGGLDVTAQRKSGTQTELESGEHIWTVGKIGHANQVGETYGKICVRFKLSGSTLTYLGDAEIAEPIVGLFASRMAAELFKSSDVTTWLAKRLRDKFDAVAFGALGWLVPARHVADARKLCEAVQGAGFGSGWVTGLPVATSDQLRNGIVQGLVDEVTERIDAIRKERADARAAKEAAIAAARDTEARDRASALAGDIGSARAETHMAELRKIGQRIVAYGAVLGENRVDRARRWVGDAMAELEGIAGTDYTGIRERFHQVWEELEFDRKRNGGVL